MIESATNKLLHAPTTRLKHAASSSDAGDLVHAVHHLFDLPALPEAADERDRDSRTMKTTSEAGPPPSPLRSTMTRATSAAIGVADRLPH